MKTILILFLSIAINFNSYAVSKDDQEKARKIGNKAITIMDKGELDKSIEMLEEAKKIDPDHYIYPYEIGYAYFLKKDYPNAIKVFKKVIKYKNNTDQCFTMLGNILSISGETKKAIAVYKQGQKKFSKSGRLYYELGIVHDEMKKYNKALSFWEKGISVAPRYPSNYYAASLFFNNYTDERVWAVLYSELFLNIERGSKRTKYISKLVYDAYNSAIKVKSNKDIVISFTKSNTMSMPDKRKEIKLPFPMQFEMSFGISAIVELNKSKHSIKFLHHARKSFIKNWYKKKLNLKYKNILFDWHKKLINDKMFEAYNYWLFSQGNTEEFSKWSSKNGNKFNRFIKWFKGNPLVVDKKHAFHRIQYM